jgi:phosphoribosyl-ATP pyrophosphohydrolase
MTPLEMVKDALAPLNYPYESLTLMLREFFDTFNASYDPHLWVTLIEEECGEYEAEVIVFHKQDKENILKEVSDIIYVLLGLGVLLESVAMDEQSRWRLAIEKSSVYIKHSVTMFGAASIIMAVYRVHESNMSKLGEDGKPIYRDDGKVLKGPNYKPPYMKDLL